MSFVIFEGDFLPSKVEVAGTERNRHFRLAFFASLFSLIAHNNINLRINLKALTPDTESRDI